MGEAVEELRERAWVISSKGHFDNFIAFFVSKIIRIVFSFTDAVLYLELEIIVISLVLEEIKENFLLVLLEDDIIPSDEGGEEPKMLRGEVSLALLRCFFKEIVDELIDDAFSDHGADGDWVILEDIDQAFLNEGAIDVVALLQEQLDPT